MNFNCQTIKPKMLRTNHFKQFNHYLCQIPSALAGLALAIGSLGFCWENVANLQGSGRIVGATLAGLILLPIVLKYLFNKGLLIEDLQHPVSGSVIPTLPMAIMVFANHIASYHLQIAEVLSWLAIALHLYFFAYFTIYRSKHFIFEQILPSWFIPPIGLALPIITHPGGLPTLLADAFLLLGLVSYAVLLPVVIYRLIFARALTTIEKPIIVILATPASLLLLSYFAVEEQPNHLMVTLLLVLAVSMTFYVYFAFIKLLRLPFTLTYSAFTFPLVVGGIALFKVNEFLSSRGVNQQWLDLTLNLANFELVIASIMVCYVVIRYLLHFLQNSTINCQPR